MTALFLEQGKHYTPDEGMCLMEAVAFIAGEKFTDHPKCVSLTLAAFGRTLNDSLMTEQRQRLIPLIPKLIGTVGFEEDERDSLRCAHWLVTHWAPAWLDLVPELAHQAAALRAFPAPESSPILALWIPALGDAEDAAVSVAFARDEWADINDSGLFTGRPASAVAAAPGTYLGETVRRKVRSIATYAARAAPLARLRPTSEQLQRDSIDLFVELVEGRRR
jgi:hypothetical protein